MYLGIFYVLVYAFENMNPHIYSTLYSNAFTDIENNFIF